MSMEYCHGCDRMIDTDFNAEHFIIDEDARIIGCVEYPPTDKEDE